MNKVSTIAWGFGIAVLITGCAFQSNTREQALQQPVNCDTAEGIYGAAERKEQHRAAGGRGRNIDPSRWHCRWSCHGDNGNKSAGGDWSIQQNDRRKNSGN